MIRKHPRRLQVRCAVLAAYGMMASGNLMVARAQVLDDIFFMAGQSNAKIDVAQGIRDVIKASGRFNNPRMIWSNHNGSALYQWFNNGIPASFYYEQMYGFSVTGTNGFLEAAIKDVGKTNTFRGFFWWQGESDADAASARAYATKFRGMLDKLASDMGQPHGPDTNRWTYHIALPYLSDGSYTDIRTAQINMANGDASWATYFDTQSYPRLPGAGNPHISSDDGYYVGIEMGKQYLTMHGIAFVPFNAQTNAALVRNNDLNSETVGNTGYQKLNYPSGWSPSGMPGASNTLQFDSNLTAGRAYDFGATLQVKGVIYAAAFETTFNNNGVLELGSGGLDCSAAASRLIINGPVIATVPQRWTVKAGQTVLFNNTAVSYDLRNATLTGAGTFDVRYGTFDFGTQTNSATMTFSGGGQTLIFAAAINGGLPSPLGTSTTLRTGSGANVKFSYNGTGDASWNRNVTIDGVTAGRSGLFEVATPGVTFTSSGSFGATSFSTGTLNLKLGGAGNLTLTGNGVLTSASGVCNLEKVGAGTVTLSNTNNTFNGSLVISAGKLRVTGASSVNTCTGITVGSLTNTAVFEYASSATLTRAVTVNPGSTFLCASNAVMASTLTLGTGTTVVVDGTLNSATLTIPQGGRLILRGNASLAQAVALVNNGILDVATWNGRLPAGLVNNGTVRDRSSVKVSAFSCDRTAAQISIYGYIGHVYQLQVSHTLQANGWQSVGEPVEGADAPIIFPYMTGEVSALFYRISVSP